MWPFNSEFIFCPENWNEDVVSFSSKLILSHFRQSQRKKDPGKDHWQLQQHWWFGENLRDVKFTIFFQSPSPVCEFLRRKFSLYIELLWWVIVMHDEVVIANLDPAGQHNLDGENVRSDQPLLFSRSPHQWWRGCVKGGEMEVSHTQRQTWSIRANPSLVQKAGLTYDSFKLVIGLRDKPQTLRLAPIKINVKIYISSVYFLIKCQWESAEDYIL